MKGRWLALYVLGWFACVLLAVTFSLVVFSIVLNLAEVS